MTIVSNYTVAFQRYVGVIRLYFAVSAQDCVIIATHNFGVLPYNCIGNGFCIGILILFHTAVVLNIGLLTFYFNPIVSAAELEAEKNPVVDLQSLLPKVQEKLIEADTLKADSTEKDTTVKD